MGFFTSVGNFFNDISGATSASRLNNKDQKEFAQNAHQWEVADLKKAGLNPILSAGGSGASASGGGSGAQASMGITDVANSATNLIGTLSGKEKNDADIKNTNADTAGKLIENDLITPKAEAEIKQAYSTMAVNSAEKALIEAQAEEQRTKNKFMNDYYQKQNEEIASRIGLNSAKQALTKEERARIRKGKVTDFLGTGGIFDYYD